MALMKVANRLKVAMEDGKGASMGIWQMIPGSNVSRVIARTGVDWVLVDCEHGNIDGKHLFPFKVKSPTSYSCLIAFPYFHAFNAA